MGKREIKNEVQVMLFDAIRKRLPGNLTLVNVVSELLGLGINAAYCRIRGEKPLSLKEAIRLCKSFGVSLDMLINTDNRQVQCNYYPMLDGDSVNYLWHVKEASEKFKSLVASDSEMFVLATVDIPPFNIFMYPELALFRYFSWSHLFGDATSYEAFVAKAADNEIMSHYQYTTESYRKIASTEIWTVDTFGTTLQFLTYHHEMGHFADTNSARSLCQKLMELTDTLEEWTSIGTKGPGGAPFRFYLSEIDIGNTFVLFKTATGLRCWLKLFTMHGLVFSSEELCHEVENWMDRSLQRATLISGSSLMERHKFFDGRRQQINALSRKIDGREG